MRPNSEKKEEIQGAKAEEEKKKKQKQEEKDEDLCQLKDEETEEKAAENEEKKMEKAFEKEREEVRDVIGKLMDVGPDLLINLGQWSRIKCVKSLI